MIPRKLQLRNFMCYREDVPVLDLDGIGIACLSGENGAGKSALLDALTWALWGEARLRSDDDLIALGAQEMEVDLTFALDGQDYRVVRKRNKGKRGQSWLDFQVRNNGAWKPLSGATLRETQQLITATLHMGFETFANSAFLRQGHADEFTRKEPGRRKQVLAEILGLDVYEGLETRAKERAKRYDGQLKVLEGQISELERQADGRETHIALVDQAEQRVEHLSEEIAAIEQDLADASERVQLLARLREQRDELLRRMERLRADRQELAGQVAALRQKIERAAEFAARRAEIVAGVAALAAAQAELERIEGLRTGYDALIERRRAASDALTEARRLLDTELRVATSRLADLHANAARRPKKEADLTRLRSQLGNAAGLTSELDSARARRSELQERSREVTRLRLERADLQKQIDLKHDSLVGTREELKRRLKDATTRLKDADRWRIELGQTGTERMRLEHDERQLERLRHQERELVGQVGALRAACTAAETQGKEINKKLALLNADLRACPLCGNELGHDGIQHIEAEYDTERKTLRAQYSASKRDAEQTEQRLSELRVEMSALEQRVATLPELAGRIARLESDLKNAEEVRQRQAEDQRTLSEIEVQLVKGDYEPATRASLARVDAAISGLGDLEALNREMDRIDERIKKLEGQIAEQANLRSQIERLTHEIATIENELPALHELEEQVAQINATLSLEDYGHPQRAALAQVEGELTALGYTPARHEAARQEVKELHDWTKEYQLLERAEERLARDGEVLARDTALLARYEGELSEANAQQIGLEQELRALAAAERRREELNGLVQARRRDLAVAQRDLGEKQTLLRRAEDAAAELLRRQAERSRLIDRKGMFDELVLSFGKKGVQALLIETAIPEIEREANLLLGNMTDNQMHLSFETQRDTKKGDVSETLEIKIADALGTRDYDAYSGGESFRVDFAIRIALAKLLARRAGARLETLVIDEGFGSQDAKGRERLVEAITSVQHDFKRILVVTHIQELKDMFPVQIEVTKTERGSIWALA